MSALTARVRATAGALRLDVDLSVGRGEVLAVLGPNGAGKTTLLRVLAGLHPLAEGEVRLDDHLLDAPAAGRFVAPEERSLAMLFQDLLLFGHLDVLDNVAFGARSRGRSKPAAATSARAWLERFGLEDRVHARPADLSGGEAQRVALARVLAAPAEGLLLDEPLAALDADVRTDVRRDLRSHLTTRGGPCLVVTHDPVDVAVLADRAIVLEGGQVTAAGSLADLVARPRTAWGAELAGTNLLPATARGTQLELAGGGRLTAADHTVASSVLVAVRPAAVALHRDHPEGSPRNVWRAVVVEVEGYAERVRVRLDGPVPLVAEVTAGAVAELGLRPGAAVWASVKATEVAVYPA